jgi:Fur family ferric uptake transcriptional regulator
MNSLLERFNDYASKNKLRRSEQRDAVLSAVIEQKDHLTVDEIFSLLKKEHSDIGIATVYRTINLLRDAGIVKELIINGIARYEILSDRHHDHLVCTECGTTVEITSAIIEQEQEAIAVKNGFYLQDHNLILMGICSSCRKKISGEK